MEIVKLTSPGTDRKGADPGRLPGDREVMRSDEIDKAVQLTSVPPQDRPPAAPAGSLAFAWPDRPWRVFLLPTLLLLAAAVALRIDCPLAFWCLAGNCPEFLAYLFADCEPFGNGVGVLVIVVALYQLDRPRRWALPRVLVMSLGSGLAANGIKMLISRVRPHQFDFQGTVSDTFGGWLPFVGAGSVGQSFPSAHAATAAGLAAALIWLYPRGRWLFVTLAVLVVCQRVQIGVHFLSDVLCGAALGCLVAASCLHFGLLPGWFDRLERYLQARPDWPFHSPAPRSGETCSSPPSSDQPDRSRAA